MIFKKLGKKTVYMGICLIVFIISAFYPVFFLFIIPIIFFLMFDKEIYPQKNILILILILSLVPAYINQVNTISLNPINLVGLQKDFFLDIYNKVKYNMIEEDLGNIKTMQEPKIIDDFENTNLTNFYMPKELVDILDVTLDHKEYYTGNTSLKLHLKLPIKYPVLVQRIPFQTDWNEYNYVNLWLKSDGFKGMFEFIIVDNDGDWWHYYDKDILNKKEWSLIKMPLKSFNNPSWTQHGNRKQDFDKIVRYIFKIVPEQKETGNHSVYIDEIYLSDI